MEALVSVLEISVSTMHRLCGEPVCVGLMDDRTVYGNIYTFDPINASVVLISFSGDGEFMVQLRKFFQLQMLDMRNLVSY